MAHKEILDKFNHLFPNYAEYVTEWFPNGKNSIRIRHLYGHDYIFTYHAPHDWKFETVDCFVNSMKGEQ